jgi:hypothetical protein
MAEYSRLASNSVASTGGQTLVVLPYTPSRIRITNSTAAINASGITKAWWNKAMGQGAAALTTYGTGDQYIGTTSGTTTSGLIALTGFTTVQAALALQYGPTFFLGASGGIAKTSATVLTVTTTANHGLVTGNWVTFQNLYQTTTTGMQQIAGIPFLVTQTGATTFTISWVGNSSNLTAITSGGLNTNASFKQILYPVLYAPGVAVPWSITTGTTTTVITTAPHNFFVGQEIAFRIPPAYGMIQLNSLPNNTIPGQPVYGYVTSVTNSTTFVCNINSTSYTAFNVNQPFASFYGQTFPQVLAVGDVNTGGYPYSGGALYPSPTVFNGYTASTTIGANTINGPGIQGAFFNATFQGFIIGSGISGSAGNQLYWEADLDDVAY